MAIIIDIPAPVQIIAAARYSVFCHKCPKLKSSSFEKIFSSRLNTMLNGICSQSIAVLSLPFIIISITTNSAYVAKVTREKFTSHILDMANGTDIIVDTPSPVLMFIVIPAASITSPMAYIAALAA